MFYFFLSISTSFLLTFVTYSKKNICLYHTYSVYPIEILSDKEGYSDTNTTENVENVNSRFSLHPFTFLYSSVFAGGGKTPHPLSAYSWGIQRKGKGHKKCSLREYKLIMEGCLIMMYKKEGFLVLPLTI